MSHTQPMMLVTGASGQLGRLVIDQLRAADPAAPIAALVRSEAAAEPLRAAGVAVRIGDYSQPQTLDAAFAGVARLLLISSNVIGAGRLAHHRNAIAAARRVGVGQVIYTSVLHADTSALALAEDHRQTEALLRESGLPWVVLRNGWYTENYTASIPAALAHHALIGSAGDGRIASAARADYAAAAVAALTTPEDWSGRVFELAGDDAYSLAEFAAELSRQTGQSISYRNLPQVDFRAALTGAGLPDDLAGLLSDSDAAAAGGALFDASRQLSALIGRPTTKLAETIRQALRS